MKIKYSRFTPAVGVAHRRTPTLVERFTNPQPWFISYPILLAAAWGGFYLIGFELGNLGL